MSSYQDELRRNALEGRRSGATNYNTVLANAPGSYTPNANVNSAWTNLQTHTQNQPGPYQSQWQTQIDALLNRIMNTGEFRYNVDTDPLYAQYKDKFVKEGRRAMQESMGGAAGLTGGYGSTAGQAAGQQAYGNYMTGLTDKIPELEQAAYQKWQNNLANQYNQYGVLSNEEQAGYGRYRDTVGDWRGDRDYLSNWWGTLSNQDYDRWLNDYEMYQQERSYWDSIAQREAAEARAAEAARAARNRSSGRSTNGGTDWRALYLSSQNAPYMQSNNDFSNTPNPPASQPGALQWLENLYSNSPLSQR